MNEDARQKKTRSKLPQLHLVIRRDDRITLRLPDGRRIKIRLTNSTHRDALRASIRAPKDIGIEFEDGVAIRESRIGRLRRPSPNGPPPDRSVIWGPAAAGLGLGPKAEGGATS